jgi:transcription elongation factor Elf1
MRAKSDSYAGSRLITPLQTGRGRSLSLQPPTLSPTDQRDYILDLADPERTASDGAASRRQQKHPATFQCTLCPKRFTRSYNLRSHLRTHTDERPFVCSVCGKAFDRQHDRKRHEGLHYSQSASTDHLPENTTSDVGDDENVARDDGAPSKPSDVKALPAEESASSDEDEPLIFQQEDILPTLSHGFNLCSIPPLGHDGSDYPVPAASIWHGMMTVGPTNVDEQQLGRERNRSHLEAVPPANATSTSSVGDSRPSRRPRSECSDDASTDSTPEKNTSGSGVLKEDDAANENDTGNDDGLTGDVSAVQALLNRWLNSSTSALLLKDDETVT